MLLLNYCLTSNHAHIVASESWHGGISGMMQKLEGTFAGYYNERKCRSGAFWEDRYHCTMVEEGEHLLNCIKYVDMNMVRAGAVTHPRYWSWCGFLELVGEKNRYRLLDVDRLFELMGGSDRDKFRQDYRIRIQRAIEEKRLKRDSRWTESIAVGSETYVKRIAEDIKYRRRNLTLEEGEDGAWFVWEPPSPYRVTESRRHGTKDGTVSNAINTGKS